MSKINLDELRRAGLARYRGHRRRACPAIIKAGKLAGHIERAVSGRVLDVTINQDRPELVIWIQTGKGFPVGVEEWRILRAGEKALTPRAHLHRFSRPLTRAEQAQRS